MGLSKGIVWRDEPLRKAGLLRPDEHRFRGELGPVVGDNQARLAARGDERVECACDLAPLVLRHAD